MNEHRAVLVVVAIFVANLVVIVAVRSLIVVPLPPSFTSPLPRRTRKKIVTLHCFRLLLVIVVEYSRCCHHCRLCCCPHPPRPSLPPCQPSFSLLFCQGRGWWYFNDLLFPAFLDIISGQWPTSSLLDLEWFLSLSPSVPSHVGGGGWQQHRAGVFLLCCVLLLALAVTIPPLVGAA